jgi:membrane protease YdiL (CAAX protease family)
MTELAARTAFPPAPGPQQARGPGWIELYNFRFRLWPIVAAALLMEGILIAGRIPAAWIWKHGPADWSGRPWIYVGLAIIFQALLGLAAIAIMRQVLPQADAHLRLPEKGRAMIGTAILAGIAMALIMLVADYWPQMLSGTAPKDYPVNAIDSAGWLFSMGITGFAEEPIFRGLLVGGLAVLMPGRLRMGRLDLPFSAYLVALMFGLAHWQSFTVNPLYMAAAQQVYAFAWGIIYVWLMERSRSLVAPIIAHGLSDAVEVGLVMAMTIALS